jgi:hypothetical protein
MNKGRMKVPHSICQRVGLVVLALLFCWSSDASAQGDGPRVFEHGLSGTQVVNFWYVNMSGNANPLDSSHVVRPNANFDANMAIAGYSLMFPLLGRSATASIFLPVGNLDITVSGGPVPASQQTGDRGFGSPMLQLNTNLIGASAMNTLADMARYEPKFNLDLLTSLILPVGTYDSSQIVNMSQNRWIGRVGTPMMLSLGPWVPGQKTTLEFLPAGWFFGDNNDYAGQKLKNDPMLQLEGHLTRDLTETLWASADLVYLYGASPTVMGVQPPSLSNFPAPDGRKLENLSTGFTMGFQATQNLLISASYSATVNGGNEDLKIDQFRLMLTYGWHPLIEGMKRLKEAM